MTRLTIIGDVPQGQRCVAASHTVHCEGCGADPRLIYFADHAAATRYARLKAKGGPVVDRCNHLYPGFASE